MELHSKLKLITPIDGKKGQVALEPKLKSTSYTIETEFVIKSELETSSGLGLFLLKKKPKLEAEKGNLFGYREEYNGVGVFLH